MATGHVDTFCADHLPPREQWPVMLWDLPALQYPGQLNCAVELLDGAVERGWGGRPCMASADGAIAWTYADLLAEANRLANLLVDEYGLVPGGRVLMRAPNNPQLVAWWFAVVKAGGVAVATMPLLRAGELQTIVDKAQVGLSLCDPRLEEELAGVSGPTPVDLAAAAGKSPEFANCETAADDVVLLAFTSGTTGVPKATMHFHRDVLAIADTFGPVLSAGQDDVFCGTPPIAFTFGLGGLVVFPMRVGASTVLTEAPGAALLDAISEHRCTVCFTAPTGYRGMVDALDDYDLSSLAKGVSAGETLPEVTWRSFHEATGVRLIDGLGATEMLHIFISASGDDIRPGATGKPIPGFAAQVVDPDGVPVPDGEIGQLAVRGPTGCRYLDDPRQLDYVRNGWNHPGDTCVRDADGYYWYQARADDMIISAGYNIAGPEVEASLLKHPAVAECAVVGVPDEARGAVVRAVVVLRDGHSATADELSDFVKADIAPYKYPRQVDFVDTLPKTETGKIQRFKLR